MFKYIILFLGAFIAGFIGFNVWNKPKLSVVMPTYNRPAYLVEAIESVLAQTYGNFEFIIIDNGSEAPTRQILKNFARQDSRIKLVFLPHNKGISYARNLGNDMARGDYIIVMDSDDYSLPHRFEKQLDFMEKNKHIAVATSHKKGMDGHVYNTAPMIKYEPFLLFGHYLGHPEWVVRKDFIRKNNIRYDETRPSNVDYNFLIKVILAHGEIGYIDENLLLRRIHKENSPDYYRIQKLKAIETAKNFMRQFDVPEEVIERLDICEIMSYAVEANKTKKYLHQDEMEKFFEKCMDKVQTVPPAKTALKENADD